MCSCACSLSIQDVTTGPAKQFPFISDRTSVRNVCLLGVVSHVAGLLAGVVAGVVACLSMSGVVASCRWLSYIVPQFMLAS